MRKLEMKEWIAVAISAFVAGFFFMFGQILNPNTNQQSIVKETEVTMQDTLIGGGDTVKNGDRVAVHYTGYFVDGTIFDSSLARGEELRFTVGAGQVIKGWDDGLVGMKVGGKRLLSIPPEFGYGSEDYGSIPGGSTLIFDIQLVAIEN